jgi:hypothetical protein
MKMEQIECSETSAYKIQTPGNHPEENIQHIKINSKLYYLKECAERVYSSNLYLHKCAFIRWKGVIKPLFNK